MLCEARLKSVSCYGMACSKSAGWQIQGNEVLWRILECLFEGLLRRKKQQPLGRVVTVRQ